MLKLRAVVILFVLMAVSLTFFACEMPVQPDLSCSGTVVINGVGLESVIIKSDVKHYAMTNEFGEYSFQTKAKTLTIKPYLAGYAFEPSCAVLHEGENTANFVATKVENLQGTLTLSKIVITPTSILSSMSGNYLYNDQGIECLKSSNISIFFEQEYVLSNQTKFLYKNEPNEIIVPSGIDFESGELVSIGILINAHFMWNHMEGHTTDSEYVYKYITKSPTTANLKDGKVIYKMYGVNNISRVFTFDIAFVFDFEPAN